MAGYYYDRREDETPSVVADAVFAALIQLFIPFQYNEPEKNFKKSQYFLIDRELFAYTDVIRLSFHKISGEEPVGISPLDAVIYRFATAYFLHCMVNRKLSSCGSEFHELAGPNPDTYLLDELFKAANVCCIYHPMQKWLSGTLYVTKEGKYLKDSLRDADTIKLRVFEAARSCRFTLRDLSGRFEYSWKEPRHHRGSMCIVIEVRHPLEKYATYEDMVKGLLQTWSARIFESFREEIVEEYRKGLDEKEKKKLAVRGGNIDISDISFKVTENFYWKLLGLKRRNTVLSQRFGSDLELMLYTLSVGENLSTYEQLRGLRIKKYSSDTDSEKGSETEALKKTLLNYLILGPERYMRALDQLKDLFTAGISCDSLLAAHDKVIVPNMPRMVLILIALDRYTGALEDIRRLENGRKDELISIFREAFIKTEVTRLRLITKEEIELLLETDCFLGAKREDLESLRNAL